MSQKKTNIKNIILKKGEGDYKLLNLKREQSIDYELDSVKEMRRKSDPKQNDSISTYIMNNNTPTHNEETKSDHLKLELLHKDSSEKSSQIKQNIQQRVNTPHYQKRVSQLNIFESTSIQMRKQHPFEQFSSAFNNTDNDPKQQNHNPDIPFLKKPSIFQYFEEGQENTPLDAKSGVTNEEKVPVKLMKAIHLLVNVKHFYRQLTKNSRIFEKITQRQHRLIGDVTARYKKHIDNSHETTLFQKYVEKLINFIMRIITILKLILRKIQLFQPNHFFKRIWDTFMALIIIYFIYINSLVIFFSMGVQEYNEIFTIGFILFIIDMIFTFNTAIIVKGNVNTNRIDIASTYLKGNLTWDVLSLVPFIVIYFQISINNPITFKIAYGFILFKLFLLSDILDSLTFFMSFQKNKKNLVDLFKVIFLIVSVCHLFSIMWHGLALYEMTNLNRDDTWINNQNLVDASVEIRYIYSFYFLAVTMNTVGYGDIVPKNPIEIMFTVITMFCTGMVWAFSLNSIGNIIQNINKTNQEYKNDMELIHCYMRDEQVDSKLRVKVSNYLEYLHKESKEAQKKNEKEIINKLSKQLQQDLAREVQGKFLKDIPLIKDFVSEKTQLKLIQCMEEILFSPNEIIFKQQDVDDSAVYYIVKGSVELLFESQTADRTDHVFSVLHKKQYFGEISFLTGQVRGATARASDFCRLFKIKREYFLEMVKTDKGDYENFQMVKEAVTLKNNLKFASIRCYLCNQGDHLSIKCPKTQLTLTKQIIFLKHNFSVPILQRVEHQRRKKDDQYRSRQKLNAIQEIIFNFINNPEHQEALEELEKNFIKPDEEMEEESSSSSSSNSDTDSQRTSTSQLSGHSTPKNTNSELDFTSAAQPNKNQRKSSIFATTNPRNSTVDPNKQQTNQNRFPVYSIVPSVNKLSTTQELESEYYNSKKRTSGLQFFGSYNLIPVDVNMNSLVVLDNNHHNHTSRRSTANRQSQAARIEEMQMLSQSQLQQSQQLQQPYQINLMSQNGIEESLAESKKSISIINDKPSLTINLNANRKDKRHHSQLPSPSKDKEKGGGEKDKEDKIKHRESYKQRMQMQKQRDHIRKSVLQSQIPNVVTFAVGANMNPVTPLQHHNLLPILSSNISNTVGWSRIMSSNFNKQYTSQTTGQDQKAHHYITLEEMNRKFDKMHNFKVYYPHNNSTEVLAKYEILVQKNIEKLISRNFFKFQFMRKQPKKVIQSKNNLSFNKDFQFSGTPIRNNKKKFTEQPKLVNQTSTNIKREGYSMKNLQPITENQEN